MAVDELRYKVATASRILGMLGLVRESTGHVSARIPGTDEMWVRCRGGDEQGLTSFQKVFLFDISPPDAWVFNVGGRVYVRFDHGREPLVWRWYRAARQLLLARFNV